MDSLKSKCETEIITSLPAYVRAVIFADTDISFYFSSQQTNRKQAQIEVSRFFTLQI